MLPAERKNRILELLLTRKNTTFTELQTQLQVSRSTLYRDLATLEKEGCLTAKNNMVSLCDPSQIPSLDPAFHWLPVPPHMEALNSIAEEAVNMISEMDSIFLSEGLLCFLLAKKIRDQSRLKNITIVTNNFSAALELYPHIAHVYVLGGDLLQNPENLYTGGPRMESNLSTIFLSKSFAAVDGVDLHSGYTMHELSQLSILSHLPDFSAETIFLIPSHRFGYNSVHQLAPLSFSDRIITDWRLGEEEKKIYSALQKPKIVIAKGDV